MASIGKFVVSAISGTQETQLSLASVHVDFSMIKVAAPDEYKRIGQYLSKKRKCSAEEGSVHRTARQLGALFEGTLPEVPHLIRAYGLRASEITENQNDTTYRSRKHGVLHDHIGVDGRAHWAAATSGRSSLQVLLLACILARTWKSVEAVSIWSDLVSARKVALQKQLNGHSFNINTVTASQLEISRDALAEWDDSARAWLAFANIAKQRQCTQLMLIIDNLDISTKAQTCVYDSIIEEWTQAMLAVDQLVSGKPFRVQRPSVLIGLTAWHLFPDMSVLGNEQKLVEMRDHLVQPGGLLTIGVQTISPKITCGVSWTLPLKHLRYYGGARMTNGGISATSSYVSFEEFLQVTIGSMIIRWGPRASSFRSVAIFLLAFGRKATRPPPVVISPDVTNAEDDITKASYDLKPKQEAPSHWPEPITDLAESYLRGVQHYQEQFEQCVELGRRRFAEFFAPIDQHPMPGFGLCDPQCLFSLMDTESVISALRILASKYYSDLDLRKGLVIHKRPGCSEIASLLPQQCHLMPQALYTRWVILTPITDPEPSVYDALPATLRFTHFRMAKSTDPQMYHQSQVLRSFRVYRELQELCGFVTLSPSICVQPTRWDPERAHEWVHKSKDFDSLRDGISISSIQDSQPVGILESRQPPWIASDYMCLWTFGDLQVFVPVDIRRLFGDEQKYLPLEFVAEVLNSDLLSGVKIRKHMEKSLYAQDQRHNSDKSPYFHSLAVLDRVAGFYTKLPGALVSLSVLSMPLWTVKWRPTHLDPLNEQEAFACIALFATGQHNLDPSIFLDVIGISYGNTLYVLDILLNDPWQSFCSKERNQKICCLTGNVGSPGLSLLVSVDEPMQDESNLENWRLVNHHDYDGKLEDNFRQTSLQLSLTGYAHPVVREEHGARYKDAFYVETVISVHDHGKWIGDVDILSMYRNRGSVVMEPGCAHTEEERIPSSDFGRVRSVDGWPEFTDPPLDACVIRASENWTARLAICAISDVRGDKLLICNSSLCWACVKRQIIRRKWQPYQVMVLY